MSNTTKPHGPIYWDIETKGQDPEAIAHLAPTFNAPGNWKDPDKIKAHQEEGMAKWLQSAALSAVTGQVLCIGLLQGGHFRCIGDKGESEKEIIAGFWHVFDSELVSLVGFNIKLFDVPFLVRRSWALSIPVPYTVYEGRYLNHRFVDLLDKWQLGDRQEWIGLDRLAKFLGLGEKLGKGSEFAGLWYASREAALEYLRRDLELVKAVAARMDGQDCEELPMPKDEDNLII